jgi:hypothetical protein
LPNIAPGSRIYERNTLVLWRLPQDLNLPTEIRDSASLFGVLLIVQEKVFNGFSLVPKVKHEVSMAVTAVVFHNMPDEQLRTNGNHRFWDMLKVIYGCAFKRVKPRFTGLRDAHNHSPQIFQRRREEGIAAA